MVGDRYVEIIINNEIHINCIHFISYNSCTFYTVWFILLIEINIFLFAVRCIIYLSDESFSTLIFGGILFGNFSKQEGCDTRQTNKRHDKIRSMGSYRNSATPQLQCCLFKTFKTLKTLAPPTNLQFVFYLDGLLICWVPVPRTTQHKHIY